MNVCTLLICILLSATSGELFRMSAAGPAGVFAHARHGRMPKASAQRPRAQRRAARQKTPTKHAPVGEPSAVERDFENVFGVAAKGPAATPNPG
jgi:hypothetical protein